MSAVLILGLLPVVWLGFVLLNLLLFPRAVQPAATKGLPRLSVLIPARNEASTIGPCVESMIRQVYPEFELVVLDDHSTDGTGAIARAAAGGSERFRLLKGRPLPEGWLGKSWACHQLAEAARGDLLLFMDADTLAEPGLLLRLVATMQRWRVDLLSGFPKGRYSGIGEALFLALKLLLVLISLPIRLVPLRNHSVLVAAMGTCLLIKRDTYRRAGGHAAIRHSLVDDLALARLVKRNRNRVLFCNLSDGYQCRLYRSTSEGWSAAVKSLYPAMGRSVLLILLSAGLLCLLFLFPPIVLIQSLLIEFGEVERLALVTGSVSGWLLGTLVFRSARLPGWLGFVMPILALLFVAAAFTSAWRGRTRKGYEWKGRRYA